MNLSDKVINEQGNVATYCAGADARLRYVDVNGEDKKYLIEGEAAGTDYITTVQPIIESNKFVTVPTPIEQLNLQASPEIKNYQLVFTTGDTFTNNLVIPSGMYIQSKLNFSTNSTYKLLIDNNVISYVKLTKVLPKIIPSGVLATIQHMAQPGDIFSDVSADWSNGLTLSMYWDVNDFTDEKSDLYEFLDQLFGIGLELGGGATGMCAGIYKNSGDNEIKFQALNDQAGSSGAGDWDQNHSLIFTVDRTAELIHFYIDGSETYTTNADEMIPAFGEGISRFFAGGVPVKNIRIWNRPLTAGECKDLSNSDSE